MAKNQLLKTFVVVAATMLFLFSVTRLLIYRCCVGLVAVWLCYFFFIFVWFVCSFNFGFSIELKTNEQQQLKLIFNICVVLTYIHLNHKCTLDSFCFQFSLISLKRSLRTFFFFSQFQFFSCEDFLQCWNDSSFAIRSVPNLSSRSSYSFTMKRKRYSCFNGISIKILL